MSKGEQWLMSLLTNSGIPFRQEITFNDLHGSHGAKLRFDFGLFQHGQLFALLEFDGKQHFEYIKYFHKNEINFKKSQEWDRRKNQYCLARGIPLIRIPYWDMEQISLHDILCNPKYRVKTKYHQDYLKQEVKK